MSKKFNCIDCEFSSELLTSYKKHLSSKKHQNNIALEKKIIICDCGREFKYQKNYLNHKNNCTIETKDDKTLITPILSVDTSEITFETPNNDIKDSQSEDNTIEKLKEIINEYKNKIIEYEKKIEEKDKYITKLRDNHDETIRQLIRKQTTYTISVYNYNYTYNSDIRDITKLDSQEETLNDLPQCEEIINDPIDEPHIFQEHNLNDMIADKCKNINFITQLLYNYKMETLSVFFGEFIVDSYIMKKNKFKSLFGFDIYSMEYVIETNRIWNDDFDGVHTKEKIIKPLLVTTTNVLEEEIINLKQHSESSNKLNELISKLLEIKNKLSDNNLYKCIIKFISPYFFH